METKVSSCSLQLMDEVQDVPSSLPSPSVSRDFEALCNLTKKLCHQTDLPMIDFPPSHEQDHRHQDHHQSPGDNPEK